ncbi:aminotransferase class V-fold PLP-dependent enzyme [Microbacterium sp. NC79]|uniref:aminotransferase class V-fold PLP-dependent enzyme n=1 Tax=Microbacterium sp. NC79 TaxID=2851009 RepID=UPI001C2C4F0B|nr:aminotransferase class V-fold PLP-dependent enzyme [Microbacterium sp. NC79]
MTIDEFRATFAVEPGYLNWAAFGPLSTTVIEDVRVDADLYVSGRQSGIDLVNEHAAEARDMLSQLLDVPLDWMTYQPSTTHGLQHAIYGITSGAVMASTGEWPSITVGITRAAEAMGRISAQFITPPDNMMTPEAIAEALTPETSAVVVSLVDFRTGYRADLAAIRDVIGDDRLLIVDAVQGFGVVQADYAAADVVTGNGYKWLRAGRGGGWASFSDEARNRLDPVLSNVAGLDGGLILDAVGKPAPTAAAFQTSAPDFLACARLVAGLQDVVSVGVESIEAELGQRTAEVIAIADRFDIDVITPRGAGQRAGIVALAPRNDGAAMLGASLANGGLVTTTRSGSVRVAVHAGTDDETMRMFEDAVAAFAQHAH